MGDGRWAIGAVHRFVWKAKPRSRQLAPGQGRVWVLNRGTSGRSDWPGVGVRSWRRKSATPELALKKGTRAFPIPFVPACEGLPCPEREQRRCCRSLAASPLSRGGHGDPEPLAQPELPSRTSGRPNCATELTHGHFVETARDGRPRVVRHRPTILQPGLGPRHKRKLQRCRF